MKDVLQETYKHYESQLQRLLSEVSETKKMLNRLAKDMGENNAPYPDVDVEIIGSKLMRIKKGQFFNKPLATAVKEILSMRTDKEAMHWDDIVAALREGNFDLNKGDEGSARMTVLRNTQNFSLIGDNYFGLKEWYGKEKLKLPPIKKKKLEELKTESDATNFAVEKMKEKNEEKK